MNECRPAAGSIARISENITIHKVGMATTKPPCPPHETFFIFMLGKKTFNENNVESDFSMGWIIVNVPFSRIENDKYKDYHFPLPRP